MKKNSSSSFRSIRHFSSSAGEKAKCHWRGGLIPDNAERFSTTRRIPEFGEEGNGFWINASIQALLFPETTPRLGGISWVTTPRGHTCVTTTPAAYSPSRPAFSLAPAKRAFPNETEPVVVVGDTSSIAHLSTERASEIGNGRCKPHGPRKAESLDKPECHLRNEMT